VSQCGMGYYARRAMQENDLAVVAIDEQARRAHHEIAALYRKRAAEGRRDATVRMPDAAASSARSGVLHVMQTVMQVVAVEPRDQRQSVDVANDQQAAA